MFKYRNLPDTIPHSVFERYLMINGTCFVTNKNDKNELYAVLGNYGGEPDAYLRPTRYIYANPVLGSRDLDINEDGVLCRNDELWLGLLPLLSRYASLLAENILSIRTSLILLRASVIITAPDDASKLAADVYLKKIKDGDIGAIGENPFFDGIKMQSPPSNNGSYLTQFIEMQQYLKGSLFNEIGLNANFNMKREAIGTEESTLNDDALLPLYENMLKCRKEDITKINDMFGTSIEVDINSSWMNNKISMILDLVKEKNEAFGNASKLAEDSTEDDASKLAEDSTEDDASKLAEDSTEDDASKLAEDSIEDDASKLVEDDTEDREDDASKLAEDDASKLAEEVINSAIESVLDTIGGDEYEDEKQTDTAEENA